MQRAFPGETRIGQRRRRDEEAGRGVALLLHDGLAIRLTSVGHHPEPVARTAGVFEKIERDAVVAVVRLRGAVGIDCHLARKTAALTSVVSNTLHPSGAVNDSRIGSCVIGGAALPAPISGAGTSPPNRLRMV